MAEQPRAAPGLPKATVMNPKAMKDQNGVVLRLLLLALLPVALLVGCGSGDGLNRAAEPFRSPPLEDEPAGRVLPIGNKPEGLAADPRSRLLAIGLTNPDELALVNMDTLRVVRRIALDGAPRHLGLAGPGGPVLIPSEDSNELIEVSLPDGRRRAVNVGRQPHDAAAEAGKVFVGEEGGDHVAVVEDGRLVARLPAPIQPGGVATTCDRVAVVGVSERALELYDANRPRSLGKIDVGIGPTHVVSLRKRFFVVDTRGDALLEVKTEPDLRIHRRMEVRGAPYGIVADPYRNRLWVTLTKTNRLVELTDRRELRSYPTVRQPNSVAVDPRTGRVFVASRKDGTLQVIEAPPS